MLPLRRLLLVASCSLSLGTYARAQIQSVDNTTVVPTPGAGHDYIRLLEETVNPGNGSVSLRIKPPIPAGRRLTLPFNFAYDSNGVHFVVDTGSIGGRWLTKNDPLSLWGWSYALPIVTEQPVSQTEGTDTCNFYTYFMFQDPSGGRHPLNLSSGSFDSPNCTATFPPFLSSGDAFYRATLTQQGSTSVDVSDLDGTLYRFPGGGFPTLIEDRNGNKITFGYVGSTITATDTLGRAVLSSSGFGHTGDTVSVPGLGGNYTITWSLVNFNYSLGYAPPPGGVCTNGTGGFPSTNRGTETVITAITLPNGKQYQFSYDPVYGLLSQITYPTGAWVRYTWGINPLSQYSEYVSPLPPTQRCFTDWFAVTHRYVSFDGTNIALQQDFAYSTNWTANPVTKQTTVTHRDLLRGTTSVDAYTYTLFFPGCNNPYSCSFTGFDGIPVEQSVQRQNGAGNTLSTTTKTWTDLNLLQSEQLTLDNGFTSKKTYNYASGLALVTEIDEYDYGQGSPGPLLKKTVTNYASFPSTPLGASILDRPSSIITYDGINNRVAETDYAYDQAGVGSVASTGHDETNYSPSYNNRGNATTVTKQCFPGCANAATTYTYDETGQVLTMKDPNGQSTGAITQYSYADNYAPGTGTPPGNTNAYLTQLTRPTTGGVAHVHGFQYGYNDGQLRRSTGENNQNTQYIYNDAFVRLTETDYPDTGKTSISYNDNGPSPTVTTSRFITAGQAVTTVTTMDGLGHVTQTKLNSAPATDPDCATGVKTDTTYDGLGRVYTVSAPYCTTTNGSTTYTYDALGRTTQVTNPDSTTVLTSYTGRAVQVQDEGNGMQRVQRISQSDALGRLKSVCEVTSTSLIGGGGTPGACGQDIAATGFLTTYQYDALDNLLSVTQSGLNPRSFAYDSLSRLTSASNPESGTTCYGSISGGICQTDGYDANGNLVKKTDARNILTTYSYDALSRLTGKTYSDGTPAATFNYDQSSALGVTLTNTIGRKSSESTAGPFPTSSVFSYDVMGRISDNSQCTPQNCGTGVFAFEYTQRDLLGNVLSATNMAGVTFTYNYNPAARLTSITSNFVDGTHPGTLFSGAHYGPFGSTSDTLGNGVTEAFGYTNRGWLQSDTVQSGATTLYSFNVTTFAPNGNVQAVNDTANGNWTYTYDGFNRLLSANATGQPYTYDYDRFGNRWHQNGPHSSSLAFDANNHVVSGSGVTYNATGNVTADGSHTYTYDAENRIAQVDGGVTASYVYDAEGRRVRKTTASGFLDYLYDLDGRLVAEVGPSGVFNRGELYANGRHFAVFAPDPGPNGAAFFTHADWLGTERARTDMAATACETITSLPFGDAQSISGSCGDVSPRHFTGKERDSESGLDNFGARYDSSSMGRFMSPDPMGGHQEDPQTLNRYAYVRNNPLNLTDPTGLDFYLQCTDEKHNGCTQVQIDPNNKNQTWVQADKDGNATVITSDSIRAGDNSATVSENGVTINGNSQGIYFDNAASHTTDANGNDVNHNPIDLAGSGALRDFSFTISGNCSGTCLSSGTWSYPGSLEDARDTLYSRHSFSFPGEDEKSDLGYGAHPYSTQHRFGASTCPFFSCTNSPHISVPNSWVPVPKDTVPQGFHVDAHGDFYGHRQDVKRQGVE